MTAGTTGKIFISYRRQETAWPARQLYDVLVARFGVESVFKDVDDIEPGDDFVDRITEAVAACDVLLALIGPQWLTMPDDKGLRRLDNPDDFVRLELKAALARGVRVVPILVDGARMPPTEQLPDDIAAITRRQAVEINPVGFNTERLLATLANTFAARAAETPQPDPVAAPDEGAGAVSTGSASDGGSTSWGEENSSGAVAGVSTGSAGDGGSAGLGGEGSTGGMSPAVVPRSPATPDLPSTVRRRGALPFGRRTADPGTPQPGTQNPRRLVLVGAGVLVLVLIGVLAIWRPWTGTVAGAGPTVSAQPSVTASSVAPTETPTLVAADLPSPPIVAHRGGLEVHQFETQQAMEAAARDGYAVETDVRFTRDGVAVLVHDERATKGLDCDREVQVSKTTWSELRKTCRSKPTAKDPRRYAVPTLDATLEAIAAASPTAWVFLEVKTDQTSAQRKAFLAAPAKHGLSERTVATSFQRSWLEDLRKADSSLRRMLFVSGKRVPADQLKGDRLWGVAVEQGIATADYLRQLKELGVTVMVWVVNDTKQWAAVDKLGPDLLMTAYPAKYQAWAAGR